MAMEREREELTGTGGGGEVGCRGPGGGRRRGRGSGGRRAAGEEGRRAAAASAALQILAASRREFEKRQGLSDFRRGRLVYIGKELLPAVLDNNRR